MLTRAHEWLADRLPWVQYPRVRRIQPHRPFWRYRMPWPLRAGLVLIAALVLIGCAIALFFLGVLFWAAITA